MPEILTRVFSCEFYEISKNTFFFFFPLMAASEVALNHFLVMRNGYRSSVFSNFHASATHISGRNNILAELASGKFHDFAGMVA